MSEYPREVEITEDDLRLIDNLVIKDDVELFNVRVDSKRPFGNSSIFEDMCKILDLDLVETMGGEEIVPMEYKDKLENHAQKLGDVVEVVLKKGRYTGRYTKQSYSEPWTKEEVEEQ